MFLKSILFLLGCCGVFFVPYVPNGWWLAGCSIILLSAYGYFRTKVLWLCLIFLASFTWTMFIAHEHLKTQLPDQLEGRRLMVIGTIHSLPEGGAGHVSFLVKTKRIDSQPKEMLIKLGWYGRYPRLNAGEEWELLVRLKKPHSYLNPGGYDYEAWLFLREIGATGYVAESPQNRRLSSCRARYLIQNLRQHIRNQVYQLFPHHDEAGFLTALLMGSRETFTLQEWQVLRSTGTNHLMAIAGLHVGLLAGLTFWVSRMAWSLFPTLCLRFPAPLAAACFSFLSALFYSLLAGFPLQTKRALVMLSVGLFSTLFKKQFFSWEGWAWALLIVLITSPLEVLDESFWMSFVTVAWIIFCMQGRLRSSHLFDHYVRIQWVIMVGILPLTLLFYHEVSWVSFLVNSIAVPWFAFIIIPGCFFGAIFLGVSHWIGYGILWLVLQNLKLFWKMLVLFSELSAAHWHAPFPEWLAFLFVLAGVTLILLPRGIPGRYLAWLCFLPLLTQEPDHPKLGEVWFDLLDVGQGLASVVRTKNHVLIYDTGPSYGPELDAGSQVIIPFLEKKNIHQIDRVVVSHGDNDHIGGLKTVLLTIPVQSVLTSVPNQVDASIKAANFCSRGQHWTWDGISFQILAPEKNTPYEGNNSSCVLKIETGNQGILLTGDIEKEKELTLVSEQKSALSSTILVAPHHGSNTASSDDFIQAVHPNYVLFPIGYLNRFHFPSPKVQDRYVKQKVISFDTASQGTLSVMINQTSARLEKYRENHKKIWR